MFYQVRTRIQNQDRSQNLKLAQNNETLRNETQPQILTFMENLLKNLEINLENEITQAVNSRNPRCRPDCTNRTNRIILTGQGSAGLGDRMSVISHVGNIAAYFCAFLVVDKPCEMLNSKLHNQGGDLSCNLAWSDFRNFKRYSGSGIEIGNDDLILNTSLELKFKFEEEEVLTGVSVDNFDKAVSLFDNDITFSWKLNTRVRAAVRIRTNPA